MESDLDIPIVYVTLIKGDTDLYWISSIEDSKGDVVPMVKGIDLTVGASTVHQFEAEKVDGRLRLKYDEETQEASLLEPWKALVLFKVREEQHGSG